MHASNQSLSERLRAVLPKHLQHHAETLGDYLEAVAALRALINSPASGAEVREALQQLSGEEFPVGNGVVTFGANAQMGDVQFRDTAGRDIFNITINTAPEISGAVTRQGFQIDQDQLLILRAMARMPDNRNSYASDEAIAAATGIPIDEVRDELDVLEGIGFLELAKTFDGSDAFLLAPARKFLRNYVQNRLFARGLRLRHLEILRALEQNGGKDGTPIGYDAICSCLNITPRELSDHINQLRDGKYIRTLAQAIGLQAPGRMLLAEFDVE